MEGRLEEGLKIVRSLHFVVVAQRQDIDERKDVWWPCLIFDNWHQFTARLETLHGWLPSIDLAQCRLEATNVFLCHREEYERPMAYLLGEQGQLPLPTTTTRFFFLNECTPTKDVLQTFFDIVGLYETFPTSLKDAFHVAFRQAYPLFQYVNENVHCPQVLSQTASQPTGNEKESLEPEKPVIALVNKKVEEKMTPFTQDFSQKRRTTNGDRAEKSSIKVPLFTDSSSTNVDDIDYADARDERNGVNKNLMETPTTKDINGIQSENDHSPNYRRITRSASKRSANRQEGTLKRKGETKKKSKTNQNKKSKHSDVTMVESAASDQINRTSDETDTVVTASSSELHTNHSACIFGSLPADWSHQFSLLLSKQLNDPVVPYFDGTDEEKLDACLNSLAMADRSKGPIIVPGSDFESNIKKVCEFLVASFLSLGEHGGERGKPAALYINGIPGNGKTSGVTWCCDKALQSWTCTSPELKIVHINAGYLAADANPKQRVLNEIGRQLGICAEATKEATVLKKIKRKEDNAGNFIVLVVVDEVDMLVSSSNASNTRLESSLIFLSKLAGDPEKQMAFIGISNSMNDNKIDRIHELADFKETVTFSSYGEIELKSILEARVGHSVVASDVLTYVSKKVAETKGDARQAFDMLKNAVVFCRQQLTSGQISSGPLVTMKHVVVANKDSADLKRRLDGLSSFGKTMFCILVSLARGGRLQTTVGVLRDLVSECLSCTGSLDEQVTWDDYLVMLETLNDMGLLRLSMGNADDSRLINLAGIELAVAAKMPLCLGIQLEEVERAMINELKEPFYQKLRDNAKEILHGG